MPPGPALAAPLPPVREAGGLDQRWPLWVRAALLAVSALLVGGGSALSPVLGLAGVAAVALGLVLVHRPVLAALLAVAVGPAVSGLARGLVVPGARLSELLLLAAAGSALLLSRLEEPPWGRVDRALLAWAAGTLGLGTAAALRNGVPLDAQAVGDLLLPVQFLLLVRVGRTALSRPADRVRAVRWALLAGAAVAVLAVAQRLLVPVQALLARLTGVDNYSFNTEYFVARATGPFTIWHYLGAYLMLVALVAVALLVTGGDREVLPRPALLAVLGLALVGLVLTLTLAVLVGLVIGFVAVAAWSGRSGPWLRRGLLSGLLGGLAASPLLAGRLDDQAADAERTGSLLPETLATRVDIWSEQYLPALAGRWLGGYGPAIPPEVSWIYPESAYLQYLLQGGLVLLLLFLLLQLLLVLDLLALRSGQDPVRTALALALLGTTVALVPLHAVFPYMTGLGLPQLLWGLVGVTLGAGPAVRVTRSGRSLAVPAAA